VVGITSDQLQAIQLLAEVDLAGLASPPSIEWVVYLRRKRELF
jgi:hypothetical protein